METWLICAILSVFAAGFHNFSLKVAAEKNYDVSLINIYSYVFTIFFLLAYIIFTNYSFVLDNFYIVVLLGFTNAFLFSMSMFTRVSCMKNIDTVIFFPLYKTFGPIIVTLISLFFFQESLTFKESIGIVIGIMIPLLLITSTENKRQKNLFLGVVLAFATAVLTALSSTASKEIMISSYDIVLYLLSGSVIGLLISVLSYKYFNRLNKKTKFKHDLGFIKFMIISGLLYVAAHFIFMFALEGNLAVVFTINSFSILIPIILSIIFYKDHFDFKKGFVIFLSIVSVLLFL